MAFESFDVGVVEATGQKESGKPLRAAARVLDPADGRWSDAEVDGIVVDGKGFFVPRSMERWQAESEAATILLRATRERRYRAAEVMSYSMIAIAVLAGLMAFRTLDDTAGDQGSYPLVVTAVAIASAAVGAGIRFGLSAAERPSS